MTKKVLGLELMHAIGNQKFRQAEKKSLVFRGSVLGDGLGFRVGV